MFFFLGDQFNVDIIFDIIGQHDVLKVKVNWVTKSGLGTERGIFMTHVLSLIKYYRYVTPCCNYVPRLKWLRLVCNWVILLSSSG